MPAKTQPGRTHWRDELDHWSTPVFGNLLWVILSIPVVTMPLALVGLLAVMFRWFDGQYPNVFAVFFGTIRRTWLKCYAVAAIDIVIGGFVFLNLLIFQLMDMTDVLAFLSRSMTLFVAILLVLVNIYVWTLLAVWDAPLKRILRISVQLVFAQPLWSVIIAVAVISPLIFSTTMPAIVFMVATGAVMAYIACRGTWFVVTKYIPPHQFAWLELN